MTETQFFDFIRADELTKKTLAEAHRDRRYKRQSKLIYSPDGSGDCMFTPSGEKMFIIESLDWIRMMYGGKYHLASNNSRRTYLLCESNGRIGQDRYLEFCSAHHFSFDPFCTGCENATSKPYTFYPSNHIYHGKFLDVQKSKIADQS